MQLRMPRLKRAPSLAIAEGLFQVASDAAKTISEARSEDFQKLLTALGNAAERGRRAWSGSNLGYHATVYYAGLEPAPAGTPFSPEWGLLERWPTHQPDPGWISMDYESVFLDLIHRAGISDIAVIRDKLASLHGAFSGLKERAISLLSPISEGAKDTFIDRKLYQIEQLEASNPETIEGALVKRGAGWSRDSMAVTQGYRVAPHQSLMAIHSSTTNTLNALDALEKATREAALHLQRARNANEGSREASQSIDPRAALMTNLFEQYDELVADIARSKYQFFRGNVKRWLDFLDSTAPFARPILQQLEGQVDFNIWFQPYKTIAMAGGSKNIEWPSDRAKRLGIQLLLFRRFAAGDVEPGYFALTLLHSGRNINDGITDIVQQIFLPMSRELRRYFQELMSSAGAHIPGSDRVVTLDHNSNPYIQTTEGLDKLVEAVEQVNDYPDAEDKEQKLAELSAGRRLLRSAKVRYAAVVALLGPPLAWLAEKFAGGIVGQLAGTVWQALKSLINL
jgi:hypothetical protein